MGSTSVDAQWATEPIAIIGLSCRFGGDASNPEKLWSMLAEGRSAWSEVPLSRYGHKGQYHPDNAKLATTSVKGAHFIEEDVGLFDAAFFGFPAEVASAMDPQFRLQLESTYEALENAGLTLAHVAGSNTSVYASVFTHDYHDGILRDGDNLPRSTLLGTFSAMASNRISHFYDLRGPSMSIDTGCSGALVSLHQAILGLRAREADMSIVCGSNLLLAPDCFKLFSSLGMLSPDGKCYAFDSRANGYGRGEGVGAVIIKRLSDALAAGDPIRAVIRESALNQDGKSETITSPSEAAQIELMRETYRRAGLNPNDTQYFEAHGTGTPTGDGIEARSIATMFGRENTGRTRPLYVGSVKTSLGHTEAASGIAALVKVVLAMERGQIPANTNFEKPNPKLKLDEWGLKVVTEMESWPAAEGETRRASINNFGYGGTNSHVIMEDARPFLSQSSTRTRIEKDSVLKREVLIMYGRDEQACQGMVSAVKGYLQGRTSSTADPERLIKNLAWTFGMHRTRFPSGWVSTHTVQWSGNENVLEQVIHCLDEPQFKPVRLPGDKVPRIGMVFTGQGAQWNAMARELIDTYPLFRSTIQEAEEHLVKFGASWSLMEELMRDTATTRVHDPALSIPICVAVQVALVSLLSSWDIRPTAVSSHSSGEIGAAYTVGALDLRQAMVVAYYRAAMVGEMSQRSQGPKGGMGVVGVGESAARDYLDQLTKANGKAVVACVNSPSSITIAGDETAVQKVLDLATQDDVFARRLKVDTGYHSHHMIPVAEGYRQALRAALSSGDGVEDKELDVIFSSPVTGSRITRTKQLVDPEHWVNSLTQPVEFVNAFTDMVIGDMSEPASHGHNVDVVLEVGPHTALGGPIKEILALPEFEGLSLPYMGCLVRNENAQDCMLKMALNLLRRGQHISLSQLGSDTSHEPRVLTDLPPYPWNHNVRSWVESRHTQSYRAREEDFHHLLGFPVPGTNPDAAYWRQQVRVSDSPWLRDHVVQGSILYPGAGYVCLAIEAMKQLAEKSDKGASLAGFSLRDIEIHQALVVPDSADGIEVQTVLQTVSDKEVGSQGWKKWEVWSVTADSRWAQHARGLIQADFNGLATKTVGSFLSELGYVRRIDPDDMWAHFRALGLSHGPLFQNISSILHDASNKDTRRCVTTIDVPTENSPLEKHLIHPATLDSIVVSAIAALPSAGAYDQGPRVPRFIQNLRVSCSMPSAAGHQFICNTTLPQFDAQKLTADITLVNGHEAVLEMEGLVCQSLGLSATAQASKPETKELCTEIKWAPDLTSTLSLGSYGASQLLERLGPANEMRKYEKDVLMRLRRICIYFYHDAVQSLTEQDVANLAPHLVRYHDWMKEALVLAAAQILGPNSDTWAKDSQQMRERNIILASSQSVEGELVCRLGPMLVPILQGKFDPLQLMTEELLNRYQTNALRLSPVLSNLTSLLSTIVHKNPRARVLQIGTDSGAVLRHALKVLGSDEEGGPFVDSWHFIDKASSTSFEATKKELSAQSEYLEVSFSELDIEQDPSDQGAKLGNYDLVVAIDTLHKTKNLRNAITNVRKLLKPGGSLLFGETTQSQIDQKLVFGLLPSWWTSEDAERGSGPHLSAPMWQDFLVGGGFTGLEAELRSWRSDEDMHTMSTMLSSVPATSLELPEKDVVIVVSSQAPPPTSWLDALRKSIAQVPGREISVSTIEATTASTFLGKACIFLGEVDQPLLHNLGDSVLRGIKDMVTSCSNLVWVTRGGAIECDRPEMALASGFLRVLRNESVAHSLILLDLDPSQPTWSESASSAIVHMLKHGLASEDDVSSAVQENEFALRDGVLMIPRLVKDPKRNRLVSPEGPDWTSPSSLPEVPFLQADRPLRLEVGIPGQLDTLAFDVDREDEDTSDANLVEIEPRAYGLNSRDVSVAMGQLRDRGMGLECAGIITRLGLEAADQGFAVGDKVMALLPGHLGSRALTSWQHMAHMPDEMGFSEAASLPYIFSTSYIALMDIARVRPGQSVLIHAAAGDVGQAAVILAQDYLGAEVYATVDSPEERDLLTGEYGIANERIFSSRDVSFAKGILAATSGRGVDVVLNSLSGALLQASFDVVASFGTFVELGKHDVENSSLLNMASFSRVATFASLDLMAILRERGDEVHRVLNEVVRLTEQFIVRPIRPVTVYPIGEVAQAFHHIQAGKPVGKVVLSIEPDEQVRLVPRAPIPKLQPDASYLLVGGLGGIGQSIAHWMAAHGARNIIVLSRSAGRADKSGSFVAGLREVGCHVVAISCDVADKNDLARALNICTHDEKLPPIRGVVNSAMALQDSLFEQMTLENWQASLRPKVAATWNLHDRFSDPGSLDFYIMLSSLSGILGIASQANYAAGCSFQDALARRRRSMGLPAVSLDLAIVKDVGYASISEARAVLDSWRRAGHSIILSEADVLQAFAAAVLFPLDQPQIIVGLNTGPGPQWDSVMGHDGRFQPLRFRQSTAARSQALETETDGVTKSLSVQLKGASSPDEATQLVGEAIANKLAEVFMIPASDIDLTKSPVQYGVDSLVAVELRNMLTLQAAAEISIFNVLQSVSLAALAADVVAKSKHVTKAL
ncbi:uncharacterized protein N7479_001540 [Penicillium vulpinum]|uniref:Uncharacterized protein n=1 Tax=Penicillium vulpinum TaxID=29845 RepID=A0A1V6RUN5_9EURO|nr:uncharacterized protein N7479_001540 [Penicillium vulpinum]KAJ5971622.1 hypothetical protein N7479_001540 [Penicillium vulpinum]OQE05485.1 hypothetical protein PENVUL_c024G03116 [Penicillium vulpinum]